MPAPKRFLGETGSDPKEKRLRPSLSFHSVVVEVMRVECFHQSLCKVLEPLLRKVVNEEVDRAVMNRKLALTKSPSLRIKGIPNEQQQQQPSNLKLVFAKPFSLPIFTGSKIHDCDENPPRILLVRAQNDHMIQETLPFPIKIELVVIDGDFCTTRDSWSTNEFEASIIKERSGRRPLLAGELVYTMREGVSIVGDIEFTDNSSWIRGRKFRVGARVVNQASHEVRVLQGVSEAFVVRDHRGELYKKHYPPILSDEVWRLEKIGKDGIFHKKLTRNGIQTVQDFLKLSNVDPNALRAILGRGMSNKMWDVTMKHAKTCLTDNKLYVLRGEDYELALNPTCQVMFANLNGTSYTPLQNCTISTKTRIEKLVKFAYDNWGSLEEVVEGSTATAVHQLMGPTEIVGPNYNCNWDSEAQMELQRQYMGLEAQQQNGLGPSEMAPQFISTNVEMGCVYLSTK